MAHLRRDWAHPAHICTGTGLTPAPSAPGLGSPLRQSAPGLGGYLDKFVKSCLAKKQKKKNAGAAAPDAKKMRLQ